MTNAALWGGVMYAQDKTLWTDSSVPGVLLGATNSNTKTPWVEVFGSTPFDARAIVMGLRNLSFGGAKLIDIGVGPNSGSVATLIGNMLFSVWVQGDNSFEIIIPVFVPAGSKIWMRQQAEIANRDMRARLQVMGGNTRFASPFQHTETLGSNVGNSRGVEIDPGGSANTKSAWVELGTASYDFGGLIYSSGCKNDPPNAAGFSADTYHDIGAGPDSGNVRLLVPDIHIYYSQYSGGMRPPVYWPCHVDAGEKVFARMQNGNTNISERIFTSSVVGLA